jgi:hypothetical protein
VWGASDDVERDTLVASAPEVARRDLSELVTAYFMKMNDWLAGPEAAGPKYSPEYIAFSNLRLAEDCLEEPDDT